MKKFILPFVLLFVLTSCTNGYTSHSFFAMDTFISVEADNADKVLLKELENLVYADEKKFSRTFAGCEIYEFNKNGDGTKLTDGTVHLIMKASDMYYKTDGAFSPFSGALTDLWNIKSTNPKVPQNEEILSALKNCTPSDFILSDELMSKSNPYLLLDLGGIAKGECAQNCIRFLKENGSKNAILSFGGSIACTGHSEKNKEGWIIGIKNPFDTADIIGSITVTDCFVSVSGAYERSFTENGKRYHHILDLKTGYPAESDIESTAVISKDGAVSDGLSTALFVMGKDKAISLYKSGVYDFEAILILKDGSITVTDGLQDKFIFNKDAKYKNGKDLIYNNQ